jgi:hypothetical protein
MITNKQCTHSHYYPDGQEGTPTKEEINIFRLWKNPNCSRWISFVDVTKGDKTYNELESFFDRAYQNIVWRLR